MGYHFSTQWCQKRNACIASMHTGQCCAKCTVSQDTSQSASSKLHIGARESLQGDEAASFLFVPLANMCTSKNTDATLRLLNMAALRDVAASAQPQVNLSVCTSYPLWCFFPVQLPLSFPYGSLYHAAPVAEKLLRFMCLVSTTFFSALGKLEKAAVSAD